MDPVEYTHQEMTETMNLNEHNHEEMADRISKLPMDTLIDILSRLPVKDLSQCRWVSKPWYLLFDHPSLIKAQHTRAIEHHNPPCIIIENLPWMYSPHPPNYYMVDSVFDSGEVNIPVSRFSRTPPEEHCTILDSVYGLICFRPDDPDLISRPYYICNPVTGDQICLPMYNLINNVASNGTDSNGSDLAIELASGFGFDSTTNRFKVVRIVAMRKDVKGAKGLKGWLGKEWLATEVYTLGSEDRSWRRVSNAPRLTSSVEEHNVFVAGALHWLGYSANETRVIISFQLAQEKFGEIQFPFESPPLESLDVKSPCLGVLGECLCVLQFDIQDDNVLANVWVMEGSWTLKYTIKHVILSDGFIRQKFVMVKLMKNGELLLQFGGNGAGYYDLKSGTLRPISIPGYFSFCKCVLHFDHVQSLISPSNIAKVSEDAENP